MPERATSHDNQECTPKKQRPINEILKGKTEVLSTDSQKKTTKKQKIKIIRLSIY